MFGFDLFCLLIIKEYFCDMFKHDVEKYIQSKSLFKKGDKVLVALSGGADSVSLLRVLLDLGYNCEAAHCNFHLRGEESNRDERFVVGLCSEHNVPLHKIDFDTNAYASQHRLSIEMAARELRYQWFEKVRQECGAEVIAVAHNQNDCVETFILNLVRGTGINGLKGIKPINGYIVRPMLEKTRAEIIDYLSHLNQDYVTDSTNLQDEYMRNKIRLNILPMLAELNPQASEKIAETSRRLMDVADIYNMEMEKAKTRVMADSNISIKALLNEDTPKSLLFEILYPLGFNPSQVDDIYQVACQSQSGKVFKAANYELLRDRDFLVVRMVDQTDVMPKLNIVRKAIDDSFIVPRSKDICCVDADKIDGELMIRKWERGDKFIPFGMKGNKNVSDYLTDRKFSLFDKEKQLVVCCGDKIVWLVNERSDDRFKVTKETDEVLILSIK